MNEDLRIAAQRIRHFERLGGVHLDGLDPEERHDLVAYVHTGLANYKKTVFWYQCPMCGKKESNDQEMEPMCTGPNWTDDHPMELMVQILQ